MEQLCKEEIIEQFLQLCKKCEDQNIQIEEYKQKVHSLNQSLSLEQKFKEELKDYSDSLQLENNSLKEKLKIFTNENSKLKNAVKIKEDKILEQSDVIKNLQNDFNSKKNQNDGNTSWQQLCEQLQVDSDKLNEEVLKLKNEKDIFLAHISENSSIIQKKNENIQELEAKIFHLDNERCELKSILTYKDEELTSFKKKSETLGEDVAMLRNDLEILKNANLASATAQNTKGNSLFGEVYDSRQRLQSKIAVMKKHYLDMKRTCAIKDAEIAKLLHEHNLSKNFLENENEQLMLLEYSWKNVYQQTIDELKELINDLRGQITKMGILVPKESTIESKQLWESIRKLFEENQRITLEAQEKLNSKIFSDFILSENVMRDKAELIQWKSKATKLECEIKSLKFEIERLKMRTTSVEDDLELLEILNETEGSIQSLASNDSNLSSDLEILSDSTNRLNLESDKMKIQNNISKRSQTSEEKPKINATPKSLICDENTQLLETSKQTDSEHQKLLFNTLLNPQKPRQLVFKKRYYTSKKTSQ